MTRAELSALARTASPTSAAAIQAVLGAGGAPMVARRPTVAQAPREAAKRALARRSSTLVRRSPDLGRGPVLLTIPGVAPSKGNSYRAVLRGGKPALVKGRRHAGSADVGAFEAAVLQAMVDARLQPFAGPVTVEARVYPPDQRRDTPGVEKALLDALQSWRKQGRVRVPNPGGVGAYADDRQVRRLDVEFGGVDRERPRLELRITPWAPRPRPW